MLDDDWVELVGLVVVGVGIGYGVGFVMVREYVVMFVVFMGWVRGFW